MVKQLRIADCGLRNQGQGENLNPKSEIRNPKSRGFTLIELMVVIVVLGVMMTLIIPQLGNIGDANLKRSTRHLTGMIRFLRDEAQAKKRFTGSSRYPGRQVLGRGIHDPFGGYC